MAARQRLLILVDEFRGFLAQATFAEAQDRAHEFLPPIVDLIEQDDASVELLFELIGPTGDSASRSIALSAIAASSRADSLRPRLVALLRQKPELPDAMKLLRAIICEPLQSPRLAEWAASSSMTRREETEGYWRDMVSLMGLPCADEALPSAGPGAGSASVSRPRINSMRYMPFFQGWWGRSEDVRLTLHSIVRDSEMSPGLRSTALVWMNRSDQRDVRVAVEVSGSPATSGLSALSGFLRFASELDPTALAALRHLALDPSASTARGGLGFLREYFSLDTVQTWSDVLETYQSASDAEGPDGLTDRQHILTGLSGNPNRRKAVEVIGQILSTERDTGLRAEGAKALLRRADVKSAEERDALLVLIESRDTADVLLKSLQVAWSEIPERVRILDLIETRGPTTEIRMAAGALRERMAQQEDR